MQCLTVGEAFYLPSVDSDSVVYFTRSLDFFPVAAKEAICKGKSTRSKDKAYEKYEQTFFVFNEEMWQFMLSSWFVNNTRKSSYLTPNDSYNACQLHNDGVLR